jgi:hypothetical protein
VHEVNGVGVFAGILVGVGVRVAVGVAVGELVGVGVPEQLPIFHQPHSSYPVQGFGATQSQAQQ